MWQAKSANILLYKLSKAGEHMARGITENVCGHLRGRHHVTINNSDDGEMRRFREAWREGTEEGKAEKGRLFGFKWISGQKSGNRGGLN